MCVSCGTWSNFLNDANHEGGHRRSFSTLCDHKLDSEQSSATGQAQQGACSHPAFLQAWEVAGCKAADNFKDKKYQLKDTVLSQSPEQINEVLKEGIGMEYSVFVCSVLTKLCEANLNLENHDLNNHNSIIIEFPTVQLTSFTPLVRIDLRVWRHLFSPAGQGLHNNCAGGVPKVDRLTAGRGS